MHVRPTDSGKYELRVRSRLLPKDAYFTFDTEEQAETYGKQLDSLLKRGVVPKELLEQQKVDGTLGSVIRAWLDHGEHSKHDGEVLKVLLAEIAGVKLADFTYAWCEKWVKGMKLQANLAPGTIRKRVGALSRAVDWHLRKTPDALVGNPLRMLPRGSASYSPKDAAEARKLGKKVKVDVVRDRRLAPGEHERILAAFAGEKHPERERGITPDPDLRDLYLLILNTGLRLREAYTMRKEQVGDKSLRVRCSKQWHSREAWRNVPMVKDLRQMMLKRASKTPAGGLVFPWWNEDPDELARVTSQLSRRFGTAFDQARCTGLTEHDLRHEATCRWYEMRDKRGNWLFREAEIEKIMGWAPGSSMAKRYASFRAEDLADRLG